MPVCAYGKIRRSNFVEYARVGIGAYAGGRIRRSFTKIPFIRQKPTGGKMRARWGIWAENICGYPHTGGARIKRKEKHACG